VLIVGRSLSVEFVVEVTLQPEIANQADSSATCVSLLLTNVPDMLILLFADSCLV
jgi:hypothetical protein